jgi:hypothetical protein
LGVRIEWDARAVSKEPGKSTGPLSDTGKDTSSQNATKHGGRANRLIIKGERQEDFDALRKEWFDEYVPKKGLEESLMEHIVQCKWFLIRAERNVMEAEARLTEKDPDEWTDNDHKYLQLMMRYQAWRAFEQLRKDRIGEAAGMVRLKTAVNKRPAPKPVQEADPAPTAQAKSETASERLKRAAEMFPAGGTNVRRSG